MRSGVRAGMLAASVAASAAIAGCERSSDPLVCTLEAIAGIRVDLRDGNGRPLSAEDAVGRAVDGERIEPLEPVQPDADALIGAWEAAGLYVVTVEKPGFETWVRADVRVAEGGCHIVPVRLEAVLSPVP